MTSDAAPPVDATHRPHAFWALDALASHVRGVWLQSPSAALRRCTHLSGVSTDSRSIKPDQGFIALQGERFDAHRFLGDVIARGAGAIILSDPNAWQAVRSVRGAGAVGVVLVADTAIALADLSGAYRRRWTHTRCAAVGGSNGKTTSVRLLAAALQGDDTHPGLRVRSSSKSFNNHIGVPLSLLAAAGQEDVVVCEVGTNAPGELAPLAELIEPEVGLITSLGREHLEGLGSLEGVAREEASLVRGIRDGGVVVVQADAPELVQAVHDELRAAAARGRRVRLITFGSGHDSQGKPCPVDVRVRVTQASLQGLVFEMQDRSYSVPLLGEHNAMNAAGALLVARALGVDDASARAGLARAKGPPMRLEVSHAPALAEATHPGSVHVLNDSYNANPESMLAALRTFGQVSAAFASTAPGARAAPGQRVVVLGDMFELGPASEQLHREVLTKLVTLRVCDRAHLVGEIWSRVWTTTPLTGTDIPSITLHPSLADGHDLAIARSLNGGDVVLLKGSRSMSMERVLDALRSAELVEVKPRPGVEAAR